MTDDRRRHPRVPVSIDGRWQGTATASLCKIANLSLGGGFGLTPSPPAVDEPVSVTLFFGGRGAMLLQGRVARVESGVGFGMQFGGMTPETHFRLAEEIARIRRSRPSTSSMTE